MENCSWFINRTPIVWSGKKNQLEIRKWKKVLSFAGNITLGSSNRTLIVWTGGKNALIRD